MVPSHVAAFLIIITKRIELVKEVENTINYYQDIMN